MHTKKFCVGCITVINKTRICTLHLTGLNIFAFHTFEALAVYSSLHHQHIAMCYMALAYCSVSECHGLGSCSMVAVMWVHSSGA